MNSLGVPGSRTQAESKTIKVCVFRGLIAQGGGNRQDTIHKFKKTNKQVM